LAVIVQERKVEEDCWKLTAPPRAAEFWEKVQRSTRGEALAR
jgi:hypothetical protein